MTFHRRSSRILLNAFSSYGRLLVSAIAGLFTVPIVLRQLGASDYGIFSVIAGTLSFLMFLNVALTTGAQRHIAYALGQNSEEEAYEWLTVSIIVHLCLGTVILCIGTLLSHWIVFQLLHLPPARLGTALLVYFFTIAAFFFDIVSTPHRAFLTAHEAIASLSAMASIGTVISLLGAFTLRILPGDKLLWFSGVFVFSQLVIVSGPSVYCLVAYPECRKLRWKKVTFERIRHLLSFSAWMLLGAFSSPVRAQGPALILNRFGGSVMNAAYGVAMQMNGFIAGMSSGLIAATSPAIVKMEAGGDRKGMVWLSNLSSKYAFIFLWLGAGPLMVDAEHWLTLWLSKPPAYTSTFLVILLVALLSDQLTSGFIASVQAHGRIALYQLSVSAVSYLIVPLGYIFLRLGLPPASVVMAVVLSSVVANAVRLYFVRRILAVDILSWLTTVLVPGILISASAVLVMRYIVAHMQQSLAEVAVLLCVNALLTGAGIWITSSRTERGYWRSLILHFTSRIPPAETEPLQL